MSEEENLRENDILFQIDMQLYDEFNDKIAGMNDHLGDIYSLRDVEEVENAQKDREIELLRKAIVKQQKEIEELNSDLEVFKRALTDIEVVYNKNYTSNDKIKAKIEELKNTSNGDDFNLTNVIMILKSLLEGSEDNGK